MIENYKAVKRRRLAPAGRMLLLVFTVLGALGLRPAAAQQNDAPLVPVADFGRHMAIGLSVNADNRLFVSFPNYDGDGKYALVEVQDGHLKPYPSAAWNTAPSGAETTKTRFLRIQDLYVDQEDYLWVLDSKPSPSRDIFKAGSAGKAQGAFTLIKINTKTDQVERVYDFSGLDKRQSALNDVRVDSRRQVAYLSDPGQAAIVVLDLKTGACRAVLTQRHYTLADSMILTYDGQQMKDEKGRPFSSNVNGIALTHDGEYLYFKPINKRDLFRIETRHLRDETLSADALTAKVQKVATVGVTHGLIADEAGNIYLTTSEDYSISRLSPDGKLSVVVRDRRLLWPDSMGIGKDGYLYVSCAQMQRLPVWNHGENKTQYPYRAYRVKLAQ